MGKAYAQELEQLPGTLQWAASQPMDLLRRGVQLYGDRGLLAIGSGGSFTAAAFAAELHQRTFGQPSQPITPLDTFQLPTDSGHAAGLLLSAEGKNNDILTAARQLLLRGYPAVGLTLRRASPLTELCDSTGAATLAAYDMPWGKDGFLATNSLLATLVLLWRAYTPKFQAGDVDLLLEWHQQFTASLTSGLPAPALGGEALILHGTAGRIGAIDLESKLAEAALAFGQLCNFRQFAHGRHLQLVKPARSRVIVSIGAQADPLADATLALLPRSSQILKVSLPPLDHAGCEIAAVLAALTITQWWAGGAVDPGQPDVPQFGRDLHALNVGTLVHGSLPTSASIARKQTGASGSSVLASAEAFLARLKAAEFRAIVCDFDGTFCDTVKRYDGLDQELVPDLLRLAEGGMELVFATGRGAKLADDLRAKLPSAIWHRVTLGCYSGSLIFALGGTAGKREPDPRLTKLVDWLRQCLALPPGVEPNVDCGQLGMRGVPTADKLRLIAAVNEWVALQGYRGWRTFSSGHSIDLITENAGKLKVVEHVCDVLAIDPLTEVLRLGDAGDFGGNDYELLSEGLGLSVDAVPPNPLNCWNFLPRSIRGVRGTQFYLRGLEVADGKARFSPQFLKCAAAAVSEGLAHLDALPDEGGLKP